MALAIVQTANGSSAGAVPGHVVLGSTPTVGNLIVVMLHAYTAPGTIPTINTTDYIQLGSGQNTDTNFIGTFILARYVQIGDTTSLPVMATAGSVQYAYFAWEISGVAGNPASDIQVIGAVSYSAGVNPLTFPSQTPQTAGTLALWSGANNFSGSTITVPGGWTADLNTGTEPSWGLLAALHQANAAVGTPISGASTPLVGGIGQIILQTSVPTQPYVRQSYSDEFGSHAGNYNTPGFLQTAPIPGSLILAAVELIGNMPAVGSVTIGAGWTLVDQVNDSGSIAAVLLRRYAQIGDTAVLPQFFTTNNSNFFWGYNSYEISGVTGTWASDFQSVKSGFAFATTSVTTTADTTGQPNTLAIVFLGSNYASGTAATVSGGWTIDTADGGQKAWGSSKSFVSSGTSVSNTIGLASSSNLVWQQILIGAATAVSVNLNGAAASGAVAGATPNPQDNLGIAAASAAVAATTPRIAIALQPATSSAAAGGAFPGQGVSLIGASASGSAAPVIPKILVALAGVAAAGAVARSIPQEGAILSGVGTSGAAAAVVPGITIHLTGVVSSPAAAPITFGQQIPFPIFSIMRDTPIALVGSMSDAPIALIARLPPSGPEPTSIEVLLVGVGATCHAATITPSYDVRVHLPTVRATGAAAPVIAA